MGILLVVAFLAVLSSLALTGRVANSRRDTGRFDWNVPMNASGRDPSDCRFCW